MNPLTHGKKFSLYFVDKTLFFVKKYFWKPPMKVLNLQGKRDGKRDVKRDGKLKSWKEIKIANCKAHYVPWYLLVYKIEKGYFFKCKLVIYGSNEK